MSDKVPVGVDPRVEPEDDVLEPEDDVLEPEDDVLEPGDDVRGKGFHLCRPYPDDYGNTPLGKPEIAALIPHTGAMCLLDAVRFWDDTTIVCAASSHRDPANPLATGGRLDTVCGIEYAAQAMAVHGGLTAKGGECPTAGYLASVRDVVRHTPCLDSIAADLEIIATKLGGDLAGALYAFTLRAGSETVLEGRAAVVLEVRS